MKSGAVSRGSFQVGKNLAEMMEDYQEVRREDSGNHPCQNRFCIIYDPFLTVRAVFTSAVNQPFRKLPVPGIRLKQAKLLEGTHQVNVLCKLGDIRKYLKGSCEGVSFVEAHNVRYLSRLCPRLEWLIDQKENTDDVTVTFEADMACGKSMEVFDHGFSEKNPCPIEGAEILGGKVNKGGGGFTGPSRSFKLRCTLGSLRTYVGFHTPKNIADYFFCSIRFIDSKDPKRSVPKFDEEKDSGNLQP